MLSRIDRSFAERTTACVSGSAVTIAFPSHP
jgi:hypothetical protein